MRTSRSIQIKSDPELVRRVVDAQQQFGERTASKMAARLLRERLDQIDTAPPDAAHFGGWLRHQVALVPFSIKEFAGKSGASENRVYEWMRTLNPNIRADNVTRIARALGVDREVVAGQLAASRAEAPAPAPDDEEAA